MIKKEDERIEERKQVSSGQILCSLAIQAWMNKAEYWMFPWIGHCERFEEREYVNSSRVLNVLSDLCEQRCVDHTRWGATERTVLRTEDGNMLTES